jgi:hypothetical protein
VYHNNFLLPTARHTRRVSQRVYGLALGYQDLNDHDTLRLDPLLATRVGNTDPSGQDRLRCQDKGKPLAGKSTLKRLQLTPSDANADSRYHKIVADPQAISDSWSRIRRVVGKAEYVPRGPNPRLVVPSRSAEQQQARLLYEETYGARGEMENRIKEQQWMGFAARTSTAWLRSNQLRLWFSSLAYGLVQAVRRGGLAGTSLAKTQCGSIRPWLLKIGALVRVTVGKVWVSLASACPYREVFGQA